MKPSKEFTIIVETYNLKEGTSWDRLKIILHRAVIMAGQNERGEVILADVCASEKIEELLEKEFPKVRRVITKDFEYDHAKKSAVEVAHGQFLLFLDGDCIPEQDWHNRLLDVLKKGQAVACGGYTRYEGGFLSALMSVMDFGFFYPRISRPLKCYASNNCGFARKTLEAVPVPEADMRCRCYLHAQCLKRGGTPVQLVPEARVLHQLPPVVRERTRQGYDLIVACWKDPKLPEASWIRWGIFSIPAFYLSRVLIDWYHVWVGRKDLELVTWQVILSFLLFPIFRLLDIVGMLRAFLVGPSKGGWGGFTLSDFVRNN